MPDFLSSEDEATLYVLGELAAAERREFEARMAKSAELRQMVRELEEGAVVLSTGLPPRRPPSEVWIGIEKAVGRERKLGAAAWWRVFWRSGWAAAAVCLVGWLLYAILLNRHNVGRPVTTQASAPLETVVANTSPAADHPVTLLPRSTNAERQLLQIRAEEINELRLKMAAMTQQSNELSQLLAQQQARLGETNRIKFYQFTSTPGSNGDGTAPQLSPVMQRAVLISIGRELGWLPMAPKSASKNGAAITTIDGIDFVDMRPPTGNTDNQPANPAVNSPANQQTAQQPQQRQRPETQSADVTEPSLPAYVSGDKLVVGLDPSVAPPNSSVTLSVSDSSGGTISWNLSVGDNPTMVTVPVSTTAVSGGGLMVTINSVGSAGISNVTRFFTTTSP
jgi:anti-sigma-K factor RskA